MRAALGVTGVICVIAAVVLTASGCQAIRPAHDQPPPAARSSLAPTSASTPAPPSTSSPATTPAAPAAPAAPATTARPTPGTVPPPWLGTRPLAKRADGFAAPQRTPPQLRVRRFTLPDTVPPLPGTGFASRVVTPPPAAVLARSTWQPGCPVARSDLAWIRLSFVGFDGARHTGELLVNRSVSKAVVAVFRRLYAARFPIEEMRVTRRDELDAAPTGDGNNTSGFVCRPVRGSTTPSAHASGLAIDVDPFQNPYLKPGVVAPELATAYADRGWRRPGMIEPDGPVVRAFAAVGWGWGGRWHSSHDLMHLSATGR